MTEEKKTGFKKNESGKRLSAIMTEDYMNLHKKAQEGAFVVWIAIVVPAEIFAGFENVVYAVPESHAAMSAGKGVGPLQCEKAEGMGYSSDICSYARIDLGTAYDGGKDSPTFGLPKPDLLISNNNNCSLLVKWFDIYHRDWGTPHYVLDVPFAYDKQKRKDLEYIVSQFKGLIETIEQLSGQKFNMDRVEEAVSNSGETHKHWKRFIKNASHRPSGITAFDTFVQMAPLLTSRGTAKLAEHYRLLADETEERVKNNIFPVPEEKYRLLWDNIAPWHQLRKMSKRLLELKANITTASYTYCLGSVEGGFDLFDYNGKDPLEYLARVQNFSVCPMGMKNRFESMTTAIERNSIDGVVFASNRSCKVYSVMQMDQQKNISKTLGIPCTMIDVDHADARKYTEANVFLRIEALLESIDAGRVR
ncbi:MAG: 2-hydroxyacyl-CoA dehydratase [bacterium]|nr:2-hydroxyacyl-CoA dehydratase [bacterium]